MPNIHSDLNAIVERRRDLRVIYEISKLLLDQSVSLEDCLNNIVCLIAETSMHPASAQVKIQFNGYLATTENYDRPADCPFAYEEIIQEGHVIGHVELYFQGFNDRKVEDPLFAEKSILKCVAQLISLSLLDRTVELEINKDAKILKQIIDYSPAIAFIWGVSENYPVLFVSDAIKQFGYNPGDFLEQKIKYTDIIDPGDKDRILMEVESNLDAKKNYYFQQYRIVTASKETRWVYDWTHAVYNNEGQITKLQGIVLDVTDSILLQDKVAYLLETVGSMFIAVDENGIVLEANNQTCELVGIDKNELIGREWVSEFIPENEQASFMAALKRSISDCCSCNKTLHQHTNHIIADGKTPRLIEWSFAAECNQDGRVIEVISFGRDITEENQTRNMLQDIMENMPGAIFQYALHSDETESINYMSPGCKNIWEINQTEIENDPTVLRNMIMQEDLPDMQKSVVESAKNMSQWHHEWEIQTPSGEKKWLSGFGTPRHNYYGDVIWNTLILDISEQKKSTEAVSSALRKTIYVLAAALEKRDPYTAGHEENVTKISGLIGRRLHLEDHRLAGLELAAMIHDVGKIMVPAEILSKPTKLLKAEFDLIKMHPQTGADLIREIDFEWPIADMILQHHERIDGSGYPNGLKGDEILLEARIIAVADTLEAMASHRPYRPGLGIDKAAEEIRSGAGVLYDLDVANACLELIESGDIKL